MKKSLMITFLSMKKALLMKKLILCIAVLVLMLMAARSLAEDTGRTVILPINASERKDYQPFMEDEDITDILVAEGNEAFISIDGVLFTADGKELLLYPTGRMEETYIVPEGTERIDDECTFNYD